MLQFLGHVFVLMLVAVVSHAAPKEVDISSFDVAGFDLWEAHSFEGETDYQLKRESTRTFVRATSDSAASGLVREIEIDLRKTPILAWRWRAHLLPGALNEQEKTGDDYGARVYVVVSGGFFFWRTKALNFVWSNQAEKHASWPNAFAPDNALMLALRNHQDEKNVWYEERVNVAELLESWLGEPVDTIHAIAIMTDTDNSGLQAQADYADIRFLSE